MGTKVLVIDDDQSLCHLLKKYLEIENFEVVIKNDGGSGLEEAQTSQYHLIVLDVMLPVKNGLQVLTAIRKTSKVPILMLTAKDSESDKVSGLRLGADDYLTKPFSINEFTARVESLIRRYRDFNDSESTPMTSLYFKGLSILPETRQVIVHDNEVVLTAKEFDLLYFLAKNKERVFTKKQIYKNVWESEYAFDDNNIMVHIRRLRKKVEPDPKVPTYIQTVWGVGYKFSAEVKSDD